jgi:hypothetical protein
MKGRERERGGRWSNVAPDLRTLEERLKHDLPKSAENTGKGRVVQAVMRGQAADGAGKGTSNLQSG